MQRLLRLVAFALAAAMPLHAWAEAPARQDAPPALDTADLGQLRHFVALARQDLDDWSGWDAQDQKGMEAYRYQIAFMTYALALQQYHAVPAYRELYRDTMARLLTRMIQKPVWEFWEETSRTSPDHDPDWEGEIEGWRDPVRKQNIMYSGHVAHMAALYEMFYRDFRWDEPGALTFRWDANEAFVYDLPTLMGLLHDQMAHNPWGGIECEPNAVFPECNQHPILAFMLYDHTHDTHLAEARANFKALFDRSQMIDPESHEVVAWYRVKQDNVLSNRNPNIGMPRELLLRPMLWLGRFSFDSAAACGWTGAFMHAWEPELVASHYPIQKGHHIVPDDSPVGIRPTKEYAAPAIGPAYFAILAAEVGDQKTADQLLAYADSHYGPVWEQGRLRYSRRLDAKQDPTHNLTGILLALARANHDHGLWRLHNEPWEAADFAYPLVEQIDFPRVLVRQARWDPASESLRLVLEPGAGRLESTTFHVTQLDPAREYTILRDGMLVGRVHPDGRTFGPVERIAPETIAITTSLPMAHQFTVQAEPRPNIASTR